MTKKILMTQTTQELFIEQFEQRLREALRQHRKALGLGQTRAADLFRLMNAGNPVKA